MADDEAEVRVELVDEVGERESLLRRGWLFLRSVMPKVPLKLVLLLGMVCLLLTGAVSWRLDSMGAAARSRRSSISISACVLSVCSCSILSFLCGVWSFAWHLAMYSAG